MLYNENMVFGCSAIDLASGSENIDVYAGQKLVTNPETSPSEALAIDLGKSTGVYKDQYYARINVVDEVKVPSDEEDGTIIFNFLFGDSEDFVVGTSTVSVCVKTKILNEHRRTPLEVSLPSIAGRYCRVEIQGGKITSGSVIIAIEPTRW